MHMVLVGMMIPFYEPLAVRHDLVDGLDHAVRGQAPVLLGQVHAAPGGHKANAQTVRRLHLPGDQIPGAPGEHVVVVEAGGASVAHELPHGGQGRKVHRVPVQILPDLIEGPEPVEELHALDLGKAPSEVLVQMMMGVDEPRIEDHAGAVERLIRLLVQRAYLFDHPVSKPYVRMPVHPILPVAGNDGIHILQQCAHQNTSDPISVYHNFSSRSS